MAKRPKMARPTPLIDYAQMARQFPENGLKLLLENVHNVQEFLPLTHSPLLPFVGLDSWNRVDTTFVLRDYQHIACDVLYTAPFRPGTPAEAASLLVYLLIEQQSKPQDVMPLRGSDYVTEIYRKQAREWFRTYEDWGGIRLHPVLPMLLYTGTRRWDTVGRLSDLVYGGDLFRPHIPDVEMCYVNLRELPAERLRREAGSFGRVLHVLQQREAPTDAFVQVLGEAVEGLEALRRAERGRWLELLSYLTALVYHDRVAPERPTLQETIEEAVQSASERREVRLMGQTIAEFLQEKGEKKGEKKGRKEGELTGMRKVLLRQLNQKFGSVPSEVEEVVQATTKVRQLNAWLDQILAVDSLEELGIVPPT